MSSEVDSKPSENSYSLCFRIVLPSTPPDRWKTSKDGRKWKSLEEAETALIEASLGVKTIEHAIVDLKTMRTIQAPQLSVEFCPEYLKKK